MMKSGKKVGNLVVVTSLTGLTRECSLVRNLFKERNSRLSPTQMKIITSFGEIVSK